jgi:hypothetical protein
MHATLPAQVFWNNGVRLKDCNPCGAPLSSAMTDAAGLAPRFIRKKEKGEEHVPAFSSSRTYS